MHCSVETVTCHLDFIIRNINNLSDRRTTLCHPQGTYVVFLSTRAESGTTSSTYPTVNLAHTHARCSWNQHERPERSRIWVLLCSLYVPGRYYFNFFSWRPNNKPRKQEPLAFVIRVTRLWTTCVPAVLGLLQFNQQGIYLWSFLPDFHQKLELNSLEEHKHSVCLRSWDCTFLSRSAADQRWEEGSLTWVWPELRVGEQISPNKRSHMQSLCILFCVKLGHQVFLSESPLLAPEEEEWNNTCLYFVSQAFGVLHTNHNGPFARELLTNIARESHEKASGWRVLLTWRLERLTRIQTPCRSLQENSPLLMNGTAVIKDIWLATNTNVQSSWTSTITIFELSDQACTSEGIVSVRLCCQLQGHKWPSLIVRTPWAAKIHQL